MSINRTIIITIRMRIIVAVYMALIRVIRIDTIGSDRHGSGVTFTLVGNSSSSRRRRCRRSNGCSHVTTK